MLRSMTGYGKAAKSTGNYEVEVEARSVNNRFLEINLRLPKDLSTLEFELKDIVKQNLLRGKVNISFTVKKSAENESRFSLKEDAVDFYYQVLQTIKQKTGLNDPVRLEHLLHFTDIIEPEDEQPSEEIIKPLLIEVLNEALAGLEEMRENEGRHLEQDLLKRSEEISAKLDFITEKGKTTARAELNKLNERLSELVKNEMIDANRLEQEIALIADRVDITEECIRLQSHLSLLGDTIKKGRDVGKKLNFILQEMHREVNTIGSKTTDVEISHTGISIKEELEKIREQVQNIE